MNLIYGRAGSGKSFYCMNEIKACIENGENKTLIYIVPEQYSLAGEFDLTKLLNKNGTINIQVLSFKRLAYRLFSELGFTKAAFSKASKGMLIYHIMLEQEKKLLLLKGVSKNSGLVDTVSDMISEFKRYNITYENLKSIHTENKYLEMKLHDLSLIYEKFEEAIAKNYIDIDSRLTVLGDLVSKSKMLRNAKIWIDGFDTFTPQELNIIKELEKISNLTVTLTLDDTSDLFALNKKTANKLRNLGQCNEIYLDKVHRYTNDEMRHLEKNIFKFPYQRYPSEISHVHISIDSSPSLEIESVAKKIYEKVQSENYRYENIAILTRNIDSYKTSFERIFKKYNIPYFFDDKKELSMQPLITLITSLLDILSKNYAYENVFNYLKTGLTNIQDINDIDIIENYVLQYGISGSKWLKSWEYQDINLERINVIRQKVIEPIVKFKTSFAGKKTAKEIATELYNFLIEIGVFDNLNCKVDAIKNSSNVSSRELEIANTYIQVWNVFLELLDEFVESLRRRTNVI